MPYSSSVRSVRVSQIFSLLSTPMVSAKRPSGWNTASLTAPLWALSCTTGSSTVGDHIFTTPRRSPVARMPLLGLRAMHAVGSFTVPGPLEATVLPVDTSIQCTTENCDDAAHSSMCCGRYSSWSQLAIPCSKCISTPALVYMYTKRFCATASIELSTTYLTALQRSFSWISPASSKLLQRNVARCPRRPHSATSAPLLLKVQRYGPSLSSVMSNFFRRVCSSTASRMSDCATRSATSPSSRSSPALASSTWYMAILAIRFGARRARTSACRVSARRRALPSFMRRPCMWRLATSLVSASTSRFRRAISSFSRFMLGEPHTQ
mmetsp:Transcript_38414/g.118731  ORF Transcript_38414/g.118731 Transcript_38414/m.118731 type:complete len:322 (-) Transcript_38414:16-981(-)